jgi:hypothetical protein
MCVVNSGPPYLPEVEGDTYCVDNTKDGCADTGTCTSCTTFNQADVDHIKSMVRTVTPSLQLE